MVTSQTVLEVSKAIFRRKFSLSHSLSSYISLSSCLTWTICQLIFVCLFAVCKWQAVPDSHTLTLFPLFPSCSLSFSSPPRFHFLAGLFVSMSLWKAEHRLYQVIKYIVFRRNWWDLYPNNESGSEDESLVETIQLGPGGMSTIHFIIEPLTNSSCPAR